ncbi:MAG: S4 domain-containing protein [Saprospiraceae bacterium]
MKENDIKRLSKKVAHCTSLSRREATEIIKKGEISVDGNVEKDPARILDGKEVITKSGILLEEMKAPEYYVFNKQKNMCFDKKNEKNRPSVLEIMSKTTKANLQSIYPITDKMCGLVILTDDREVCQKFDTGSQTVKQVFEIKLENKLLKRDQTSLEKLFTKQRQILYKNSVFSTEENITIIIVEMYGLDSEKILEIINNKGFQVQKMDRTYFGGITKKDISRGWYRKMDDKEVVLFKHFFNPPKVKTEL